MGCFAHICIGSTQQVVGEHLLVGGTVRVEIVTEGEGQRVVGHQRVGLIAGLQLVELAAHLLPAVAAGNNGSQDKGEAKNDV